MHIEKDDLSARDGTSLCFQRALFSSGEGDMPLAGCVGHLKNSIAQKGTVLITHGLGEHSGRYRHVMGWLMARGWDVVTYDLRGHGRSGGRRGDISSFEVLLDDLEIVAAEAKKNSPAKPLFLYGHSLGGLITLRFLQDRNALSIGATGAIVASPWLRLAFEPPWWKCLLATVARKIAPGFRQNTGVHSRNLSRDPAFLESMPDLHLNHNYLSARMFAEIQDASSLAQILAKQVTLPVLFIHGQADPITSWLATREFFEATGSSDKTLRLYPNIVHETHNDIDRELVGIDILDWLERTSPG